MDNLDPVWGKIIKPAAQIWPKILQHYISRCDLHFSFAGGGEIFEHDRAQ